MAALATAVCGCGWDVGLAVPVLTVGHRGESLDGVRRLSAGVRRLSVRDNQPGCQSRVEGYGVAVLVTAVGWFVWVSEGVVLPAHRYESQDGVR